MSIKISLCLLCYNLISVVNIERVQNKVFVSSQCIFYSVQYIPSNLLLTNSSFLNYDPIPKDFEQTSYLYLEMATGGSTGKQLSVASANVSEESVNSKELNELKDRRRHVRSQITQCKNLAVNEIEDRGSRSYIKSLVRKAEKLNSDSQLLTEKITIFLDPTKIKGEWQRQDYYDGVIEDLKAVLEDYLAGRVNDAPSEMGELPSRANQPTLAPPTPQNQMIMPLPQTNSNNPVTSTPEVNELLRTIESTLEKKWEKLFNDRVVNNTNIEEPKSFFPSTSVTNKKESPDIWIERYVEGQEDPDEW